jgi:hypothetical protein
MGAAELTRGTAIPPGARSARRRRAVTDARRVTLVFAALWALTGLGTLIGRLLPVLAPGGRPHPSLHDTVGDVAAIAATNARTLSAPFLLTAFRFTMGRRTRTLGDLLVVGLLAGNALRVGLALGRDGGRLIPYVPQLPLEWLAAAVAGGAWLKLRRHPQTRTVVAYAATVLVLVAVSAAIETLATPHAATRNADAPRQTAASQDRAFIHQSPVRQAGGGLSAPDRAPAPALASRSLRSLPLAVARFRSAVWPALPGYVNHPRIPQGGTRK